ncbi:hypothetical protein SNE40_004977 [Patella caerulea]|uniref:BZIP domain-containing protein n=1 Tax=Patella caerulea TaxID=87958 RepID=A0AAN8KAZ0_PATCE
MENILRQDIKRETCDIQAEDMSRYSSTYAGSPSLQSCQRLTNIKPEVEHKRNSLKARNDDHYRPVRKDVFSNFTTNVPRSTDQCCRSERQFVADSEKNTSYWQKRLKNNDSARKSRWRRKCKESYLETRLGELLDENVKLRSELESLQKTCLSKKLEVVFHDNKCVEDKLKTQSDLNNSQKIFETVKSEQTNLTAVNNLSPPEDSRMSCVPLKFRHKRRLHSVFN